MSLSAGAAIALAGLVSNSVGNGFDYVHGDIASKINRDFQAEQAQINRDWQTNANQIAMDFSAKEAAAQRAWQQEMSSTAIRRQMDDLRAAGLNPILAASQLGGAATPSGATASGIASSPIGAPGGSTARPSVGRDTFSSVAKFVGEYLSNAHQISMAADRYAHERDMQERAQRHDFAKQAMKDGDTLARVRAYSIGSKQIERLFRD